MKQLLNLLFHINHKNNLYSHEIIDLGFFVGMCRGTDSRNMNTFLLNPIRP